MEEPQTVKNVRNRKNQGMILSMSFQSEEMLDK